MTKTVLFLFLVVEFVSQSLNWNFSIATGLSAKNALLYLIIMMLMIETAVLHNRKFELQPVLIPYGLIVAYSLLTFAVVLFIVDRPGYKPFTVAIGLKNGLIDHVLAFLVFFYGISTKQGALWFIRMIAWLTIIGNLVSVIDAFNVPDLGIIEQRADGRVSGPMGESNAYGAYIVTMLPAAIALAMESKGFRKYLAVSGAFITIVALFLTASRGAFVGVTAGFIFTSIFLRSHVSFRNLAAGLVFVPVVVAGGLIVMYSTGYLSLIEERFIGGARGSLYEKSSSRTTIWMLTLRRMVDDPVSFLTGFGWGTYHIMDGLYNKSTHNFYLNKLFHLGIIGLGLYASLFYNIIATCRRALSFATGSMRLHIAAAVFGFTSLCACIFFIDLHTPWIFIWSYIGMIMRLSVELIKEARTEALRTQSHENTASRIYKEALQG